MMPDVLMTLNDKDDGLIGDVDGASSDFANSWKGLVRKGWLDRLQRDY